MNLEEDFHRVVFAAIHLRAVLLLLLLLTIDTRIEGLRRDLKRQHAVPALRKCLDLSVKFVFVSERSRACEAWLVANGELRKTDEIVPALRAPSPGLGALGPLGTPR